MNLKAAKIKKSTKKSKSSVESKAQEEAFIEEDINFDYEAKKETLAIILQDINSKLTGGCFWRVHTFYEFCSKFL